jgi:hypothetical protein
MKIFGIVLDDGDGTFEFLLFAVPIASIRCLVLHRRAAHRAKRRDKD